MKSLFAVVLACALAGPAFAAPSCEVSVDGQVQPEMTCQPWAPQNPDYRKGMRCNRYGGIMFMVDYTLNDEEMGGQSYAYVLVDYLNKFGDWTVRNEAAVPADLDENALTFETKIEFKYFLTSYVDTDYPDFQWMNRDVKVKCSLKE